MERWADEGIITEQELAAAELMVLRPKVAELEAKLAKESVKDSDPPNANAN